MKRYILLLFYLFFIDLGARSIGFVTFNESLNILEDKEVIPLKTKNDVLHLLNKEGAIYCIKENINMQGYKLKIPLNSILFFDGGSIDNCSLIFNYNYLYGDVSFDKILNIEGEIKNDTIFSDWFNLNKNGKDDNSCIITNIIKWVSSINKSLLFTEGHYIVNKTIFIYGNTNIYGIGDVTIEATKQIVTTLGDRNWATFIIAGLSELHKPNEWNGVIKNIKFICSKGQYEYGFLAQRTKNVTLENCIFDFSNSSVKITNKVIGAISNGYICNKGSDNSYFTINNCKLYMNYNTSTSECIGFGNNVRNITITNNEIYNAGDDLGFHGAKGVLIDNNYIETNDGRIYLSSTSDAIISNNLIKYIDPTTNGMGIYLTLESRNSTPCRNIIIDNNIIDYSSSSNFNNYGIRIQAKNVIVKRNKLIPTPLGNAARISITPIKNDNQCYDNYGINKGYLVPGQLKILNNEINGLHLNCNGFVMDSCLIENNIIYKELTLTNPVNIRSNKFYGDKFEGVSYSNHEIIFNSNINLDNESEFIFNEDGAHYSINQHSILLSTVNLDYNCLFKELCFELYINNEYIEDFCIDNNKITYVTKRVLNKGDKISIKKKNKSFNFDKEISLKLHLLNM